jgi:hypothetical protein
MLKFEEQDEHNEAMRNEINRRRAHQEDLRQQERDRKSEPPAEERRPNQQAGIHTFSSH